MKYKILVIEDDDDIREMLQNYFKKDGYDVVLAEDGAQGVNCAGDEKPDIILLDVMMPVMDGYEALGEIRKFSDVPVIMLTAKGEQMDKVFGFNKGCDDYVVKPFDLIELSLRIKAVLRRGSVHSLSSEIIYKDLVLNENEFTLYKDGEEIKLTKKEFDILSLLLKNQGKIFSGKNLYESVWNEEYLENDNSVLTHIRNLREKLDDTVKNSRYIKTIWGVGYKIEKDI